MAVKIDLRRDLPKALRARKNLLKRLGSCQYMAPCVIGTMVPAGKRYGLDIADTTAGSSAIDELVKEGFVTCPPGQLRDLKRLQRCFDTSDGPALNRALDELAVKYAKSA